MRGAGATGGLSWRALRIGAVSLCALAGVAIGLGAPVALARSLGVDHPPLDINLLGNLRARLERLGPRLPFGPRPRLYVVGDSTVLSYARGRTIPVRLQQQLDALVGSQRSPLVQNFSAPGMSFFDHYLLADLFAANPPDLLVVNFNVANISTHRRVDLVRPPLAGALQLRRIPEALGMPLHEFGMTADRVLFYVAIVQAGGLEPWWWLSREQVRIAQGRKDLERWLGAHLSPTRAGAAPEAAFERRLRAARMDGFLEPGRLRYTARGERDHFGQALEGVDTHHETIQTVDRTLAAYRRAGIDVVFYVNPTNVEHLERVGVYDPEGFGRTLAALEEVVRRNGAEYVDLHDLLPDAGFRDAAGHFATSKVDGPLRVAEALAPVVIEKMGSPAGRR
jgi:hypothetical protein